MKIPMLRAIIREIDHSRPSEKSRSPIKVGNESTIEISARK